MLTLPRYAPLGASSRLRLYQFGPALEVNGFALKFAPLIDEQSLLQKYRTGAYAGLTLLGRYWRRIRHLLLSRGVDLMWIEKEALPWLPAWLERILLSGCPYVIDLDDAVFHNYDLHRSRLIRRWLGRRLDTIMAGARLVIAGNDYLADRARRAGAPWVELLPTVVDFRRYDIDVKRNISDPLRIVWIGSPSSLQYLRELAPALARVNATRPFVLRVIGIAHLEFPGVELECLSWSAETEVKLLKECDVGVMPLQNTPWEQGKCAYKLIQYMASSLPTVASAVGANKDVVVDGQTGFLVVDEDEWVARLTHLLDDPELRQMMARAGRDRAVRLYSLQTAAPRLAALLRQAAEVTSCAG